MYRRYNLYQRFNCPWGQLYIGFPGGSAGKESTCNTNELGLMPELGRSPGEGKGYPLQYSGLENSMGFKESDTTEPTFICTLVCISHSFVSDSL